MPTRDLIHELASGKISIHEFLAQVRGLERALKESGQAHEHAIVEKKED